VKFITISMWVGFLWILIYLVAFPVYVQVKIAHCVVFFCSCFKLYVVVKTAGCFLDCFFIGFVLVKNDK
jgi:hypothetical protein